MTKDAPLPCNKKTKFRATLEEAHRFRDLRGFSSEEEDAFTSWKGEPLPQCESLPIKGGMIIKFYSLRAR